MTGPSRLADHARGGVAVINIGPKSVSYYVHKSLLAQHSEYFDRAFSGTWKEAQEGVVTIDDVDCDTFEVFVHWLYTQKLPNNFSAWTRNFTPQPRMEYKALQTAMLRARVFADRFIVPSFGEIVECAILAYFVNVSCAYYEVVIYAYKHLPADNLILKAMIDSHCFYFDADDEAEDQTNGEIDTRAILPNSFLVGVMSRYMKIVKEGVINKLYLRDYHDYNSEEDTKACEAASQEVEDDFYKDAED